MEHIEVKHHFIQDHVEKGNSVSKFEYLEDLGLPDLPIKWLMYSRPKRYDHVVERELVFCKFVDLNFLKKAKFSFIKKIKKYGLHRSV